MSSQLIGEEWMTGGGEAMDSLDPATGAICWSGEAATPCDLEQAVASARTSQPGWADRPVNERIELLEAFAREVEAHRGTLAQAISAETGKPRWEAQAEVTAMVRKVPCTLEAMRDRRPLETTPLPGEATEATRYKPHGVLAVLGPFNLPGHLPNGHIVPALLAGNTVVFKPSDKTPWTAIVMGRLWEGAGLPAGVVNIVQGGGQIGSALVEHPGHDGVLLTGSLKVGLAIRRALVERPEKIVALEMGGNNPLVVDQVEDKKAAAVLTVQSAFVTAGQRCTCARRLIVPQGEEGDRFVETLQQVIAHLRLGGPFAEPEPFLGPMINGEAARSVLEAAESLREKGARVLVEPTPRATDSPFVHPGLLDVTDVTDREDEELFGPVLQLIRVPDFEAAVKEANNTDYGLVAGLLSDDPQRYDHFYRHVRAGLINWNRPTTGASSALPFGGVGKSGNHRPSGAWAIDYCTYPVASLENQRLAMPEKIPPGIET